MPLSRIPAKTEINRERNLPGLPLTFMIDHERKREVSHLLLGKRITSKQCLVKMTRPAFGSALSKLTATTSLEV
jgi:hypothetical protein